MKSLTASLPAWRSKLDELRARWREKRCAASFQFSDSENYGTLRCRMQPLRDTSQMRMCSATYRERSSRRRAFMNFGCHSHRPCNEETAFPSPRPSPRARGEGDKRSVHPIGVLPRMGLTVQHERVRLSSGSLLTPVPATPACDIRAAPPDASSRTVSPRGVPRDRDA